MFNKQTSIYIVYIVYILLYCIHSYIYIYIYTDMFCLYGIYMSFEWVWSFFIQWFHWVGGRGWFVSLYSTLSINSMYSQRSHLQCFSLYLAFHALRLFAIISNLMLRSVLVFHRMTHSIIPMAWQQSTVMCADNLHSLRRIGPINSTWRLPFGYHPLVVVAYLSC